MLKVNGKATVFKPEIKGNLVKANLSTAKKDKKTDTWVNSNWSAVFVGKDALELAKTLGDKARITIEEGTVSNEPYENKEGKKVYQNPQLIIFKFSIESNPNGVQADEFSDDELPF